VVGEQFDGWNQATATDGKYKGGDHIPGMNVGGWYDAGDFDLEEPAQLSVIQSLALAYREFNLKYDELTVDEAAREVEMHRPDGVPDTVQQVKHGALLILAQFHNIGHAIRGTHEPDLRQYTHLGDGASKTDGRIYDPKLGPNEVKGDYSGKPDDRWIFTTNNPFFQWNAIAALAAAADTLKGWDDALAKDCLETAIKAWNDEKAHPTPNPARRLRRRGSGRCSRRWRAGCVSGCGAGAKAIAQKGARALRQLCHGSAPPDSSAGRLRPWRLRRRTGLGCGSGIDHRHEWRRALQVPSEGVVPSDDHPAADGPSVVGRQSGHCLIWTRARKIKCAKR
jgi:endoglucanase